VTIDRGECVLFVDQEALIAKSVPMAHIQAGPSGRNDHATVG
jgi:hypothetical protein